MTPKQEGSMTKGCGTSKGSGSRVSRKRDPKTGLTAQQERFVILIVYGRDGKFVTQAGAYRLAYDCRRSSDVTIWKRASELMANRKVAGRIAELRNAVALQSNITRELETEKLDINWRLATYGDMTIERDANGNTIYLNPDAGPDELKVPKVRIIKPNLSAAVRTREAIQRLHGLLVDPGKVTDIPPLHERLERFRKDPVITRPPVSGEITRLPPLDGAD